MKKKTRILIADDHALLRMGLASLLNGQDDMSVIAEAEDGEEAVRLANKLKPDVIIMDLVMPIMDGAAACEKTHLALPDTRILILSSFPDSILLERALLAGASGVAIKDTPNDRLLETIRRLIDGQRVIPKEIRCRLQADASFDTLSERQLDFLGLAARGFGNDDIVRMRNTTIDAVKKQFSVIFRKLDVANRSEAIAIALRKHLLKV